MEPPPRPSEGQGGQDPALPLAMAYAPEREAGSERDCRTREEDAGLALSDPAYAAALRITTVRSAYDRALEKRWGVKRYLDAPRAWSVMIEIAERVKERARVSFGRAASAVAWAYMLEPSRRDGSLEDAKHPPEWIVYAAASVEARAVATLRHEREKQVVALEHKTMPIVAPSSGAAAVLAALERGAA